MKLIRSPVPPMVSKEYLTENGWVFYYISGLNEIWRRNNEFLLWCKSTGSSIMYWRGYGTV